MLTKQLCCDRWVVKVISQLIVWRLMNSAMDVKLQLLAHHLGQDETVELVMSVLATARKVDDACMQILSEYGLSESRFAVLLALSDAGESSPAALAERLGVTRATITGLLDGLVGSKLVLKRPDPTDRRSQVVTMSDDAKNLVEKLLPIYRQWLGDVAKGVDFQQPLLVGLKQLQENLVAIASADHR